MSLYLVTGCAGFIGSHLCEGLLASGHDVRGIDAFSDYYPRAVKERNLAPALRHSRFELTEGDVAEIALGPALAGVDGVFHLAAQPGVRGSWGDSFALYLRDNVLATQRLFEAARRAGVRVVFASSSSVYGEAPRYPTAEEDAQRPVSPYGVTKLACEQLAHAYGASGALDVVALRYFTVYGPRQRPDMAFSRIVRALVAGLPFTIFGTGEQSRDFTYVDDAVAATLAAMDRARGGSVYNVGGGTEASLHEVIETLERLSGRTVERRIDAQAPGDVRRTAADTRLIRSEFEWAPATSLEAGLAAQLAHARCDADP